MFKAQVSHFHEEQSKTQSTRIFYSKFEMNTKKTMKSLYLWVSFILVFIKSFLDRRQCETWRSSVHPGMWHSKRRSHWSPSWPIWHLESQLGSVASVIFWIQLCRLTKTSFPFCSVERKKRTPVVVLDILTNMSLEEKHEHLLTSQKWRNSTKSIRSWGLMEADLGLRLLQSSTCCCTVRSVTHTGQGDAHWPEAFTFGWGRLALAGSG